MNKKQHSEFSVQGKASSHAPNVRKKTWVQRAETPGCQLGSSGPVWLIQRGLCAGIRTFLRFVAPSYIRPSDSRLSEPRPPVLGDSLRNPTICPFQVTAYISREPFQPKILWISAEFSLKCSLTWSGKVNYGRGLVQWVAEEWRGGGGFWVFWVQELEPILDVCQKRGRFMRWMAVMCWKLVPPRGERQKKSALFSEVRVRKASGRGREFLHNALHF